MRSRDWWCRPFRNLGTAVGPLPFVRPFLHALLAFQRITTLKGEGFGGPLADVPDLVSLMVVIRADGFPGVLRPSLTLNVKRRYRPSQIYLLSSVKP